MKKNLVTLGDLEEATSDQLDAFVRLCAAVARGEFNRSQSGGCRMTSTPKSKTKNLRGDSFGTDNR